MTETLEAIASSVFLLCCVWPHWLIL